MSELRSPVLKDPLHRPGVELLLDRVRRTLFFLFFSGVRSQESGVRSQRRGSQTGSPLPRLWLVWCLHRACTVLAWCWYGASTFLYVRVLVLLPGEYLNVPDRSMAIPLDEPAIV